MTCTRCQGTGFLNTEQIPLEVWLENSTEIKAWIDGQTSGSTDAKVCDCCGDGEVWYGTAGEHYTQDDPKGPFGPYVYNGGLCECN